MIATTVPAYSWRKRSSQSTDSASRWLVGSSRSSRSGWRRRSRASATRRFSPPDSVRDVGVVGRAAERVHRDVDVALEVPGVGRGDPVLEGGLLGADRLVVGVGVGPGGHDLVVLVDERLDLGHAVHDVALDVLGRVELGLLGEVADGEAGRQARLAGEAVVEPGHDPEEARLAGAVRPDDADLGARVERDRDVLEDGPVRRVVPGELVGRVDEFGGHGPRVAVGERAAERPPSRLMSLWSINDHGRAQRSLRVMLSSGISGGGCRCDGRILTTCPSIPISSTSTASPIPSRDARTGLGSSSTTASRS